MAVIVRRRVQFGEAEAEIEVFVPAGTLSKDDRTRAEALDRLLRERTPQIARDVMQHTSKSRNLLRRWHLLGCGVRELVEHGDLVLSADVDSGAVWQAIWYYLPSTLRPVGSDSHSSYSELQHKRKDHLSLCYEISRFEWREIKWIKRWDDWHQIAFRPGILRDKRIVEALGRCISALSRYPSRHEFREIVKHLGRAFPTRRLRDTSHLPDEYITALVDRSIGNVMGQE